MPENLDPLPIVRDFPGQSVKVLLNFARGKEAFGEPVAAAALTVVSYGVGLGVQPKVFGSELEDPAPLAQKVSEALQSALDQDAELRAGGQDAKGFLPIPWLLIAEWAVQLIIRKMLD